MLRVYNLGDVYLCHKFGCGQEVYRYDNGIDKMGVPLSDVTFQKHKMLAQLNSVLRPRPHGNQHQTQNQGPLSTPSGTHDSGSQISGPHAASKNHCPDKPSTLPSKPILNNAQTA
ncbi:hypothetical protein VP01_1193g7 [Puccinia sorghi]|uniref:Uncharacterized protein n=1 Tax=Puccinia sorghi TaxID=27349 RepID=A0A0L6VQT4_9BASI|nr:hypothetical protein VP01_1193g7 [Puccinia sorghi]